MLPRPWLLGLLLLALWPQPAAAGQLPSRPAAPPDLATLLARAGAYADRYGREFANVVAEERYLQVASGRQTVSGSGRTSIAGSFGQQRRELVSDFLLVKLDNEQGWVPFRDVFQVDGSAVRERQNRLTTLILKPTAGAMDRAKAILDESARYNIGEVERTINMPLLALSFLDMVHQHRFRFSLGKADPAAGPDVWIVEYREQTRPTIVRSPEGRNLFASGRLWIGEADGRVVRTELVLQDPSVRASIATSYRPDDRFQLSVPFEMVEDYALRSRSRVTGRATYGRFRRFDVTATESVPLTASGRSMTETVTGMVLVEVVAGAFVMGSPATEPGHAADEVPHDVALSAPYFLGRVEVTEQEWRDVMGTLPRGNSCGARCPVTQVSAQDIAGFLGRLNARAPAGVRFRLPTEAEWEYACRAGTAAPFWSGASTTAAQANFSGRGPTQVGAVEASLWGLSDMHGNVAEWTADWYGPYADGAVRDPKGPSSGTARVVRGGHWQGPPEAGRCAARASAAPGERRGTLGFRVAAEVATPGGAAAR